MSESPCPDDLALRSLLAGALSDDRLAELETHLGECARCQRQLGQLAGAVQVLPDGERDESDFDVQSARLQLVIAKLQSQQENTSPPTAAGIPGQHTLHGQLAPTKRRELLGTLGQYEVLEVLGSGGMGVVYKAFDPTLERIVAVKLMHPHLATQSDYCQRFEREAKAAAALKHDHVVTVYAVEELQNTPMIVMEYVQGQTLAARLQQGPLPTEEVMQLGVQLASALAAAHDKGLVHRDVKPANVLLQDEPKRAKLTDFGLAKIVSQSSLTSAGNIAGTPEFMSPEQAHGREVDFRSDLFCLGSLLYAACTGGSPFSGDSIPACLNRICHEPHTPLATVSSKLPPRLANIVDRLLAKSPDDRPQSAGAVIDALSDGDIVASENPNLRKQATSKIGWQLGIAGVLLAVLVVVVIATSNRNGDHATSNDDRPVQATNGGPPFLVTATGKAFNSLADAIQSVESGGEIAVRSEGPFRLESINLGDKDLTIAAAQSVRPVLEFSRADENSSEPVLITSANLVLKGITIRAAALPGPRQRTVAAFQRSSAIWIQQASIDAVDCRFELWSGRIMIQLRSSSGTFTNCEFLTDGGAAIGWMSKESKKLIVTECSFQSQMALWFMSSSMSLSESLAVTFDDCESRGESFIRFAGSIRSRQRMAVSLVRSRMSVNHLLVMERIAPNAVTSELSGDRIGKAVTVMLDWEEKGNIYAAQTNFISYGPSNREPTPLSDGPTDIPSWESFWNLPETSSRIR